MRSTRPSIVLSALVLAALTLLAAAPAAAQDDAGDDGDDTHVPRSGFWLGGGIGGGLNDEGDGGGAGYLRMGGTLSPRLLLGGDAVGFSRDVGPASADARISRSNVTASLLFFPSERGDFFVKGGVGFAYAEFSEELGDGTFTTEDAGLGVTLGAGYDVQLGDGNLFLTPNLDVLLQVSGGPDVQHEGLFLLTVGLGFR